MSPSQGARRQRKQRGDATGRLGEAQQRRASFMRRTLWSLEQSPASEKLQDINRDGSIRAQDAIALPKRGSSPDLGFAVEAAGNLGCNTVAMSKLPLIARELPSETSDIADLRRLTSPQLDSALVLVPIAALRP